MKEVNEQVFERAEVSVDGHRYHRCRFDNCSLSHAGGDVVFDHCTFKDCEWIFDGAASRTISIGG